MNFFIRMILSAISILLASYLLPGVVVDGFFAAFVVAILLALLNATLRPLLIVLTIPITVVTLGLFLLVINVLIIMLADYIVPGFAVNGFWWALLFSLIVSIIYSILDGLSKKSN